MSERESPDEVMARYIASGTSWTPLFQPRLFEIQIEPLEFTGKPNSTKKQFIEEDMLAAAMFLRHVFVPNHQQKENDELVKAVSWVLKNPNKFFHKGITTRSERLRDDFPSIVGANHQSIAIILRGREMFEIQNTSHDALVAFTLNTKDWETDLYATSFRELNKLLDQPYKLWKNISKELYSTSWQNNILLSFYWSGGKTNREEGIDTFTWRMLTHHYKVLLQRESLVTDLKQT